MPKYGDDYWFMMQLKPWLESQGILNPEHGGNVFTAGFPLREIVDTWLFHYQYDNIRLANIVAPVLLVFPKWFGSSVMLAAFVFVIWGSYRISGTCWQRSAMVPVSLCVWLFFMPLRSRIRHTGCSVELYNWCGNGNSCMDSCCRCQTWEQA